MVSNGESGTALRGMQLNGAHTKSSTSTMSTSLHIYCTSIRRTRHRQFNLMTRGKILITKKNSAAIFVWQSCMISAKFDRYRLLEHN